MSKEKPFICNFCSSEFSQESVLIRHKKTAKKCLSVRGLEHEKISCEFCFSNLSSEDSLKRHQEICKVKETQEMYEKKTEELRKENKLLKEELRNLKISTFCKKKLISVKNIQDTIRRFSLEMDEKDFSLGIEGICDALEDMRVTKTGEYWRYGKSDGKILFKYIENGKEITDDGTIKFKDIFLMLMYGACDFSGRKRAECFDEDYASVLKWNNLNSMFLNSKTEKGFTEFSKTLKKKSTQKDQVLPV